MILFQKSIELVEGLKKHTVHDNDNVYGNFTKRICLSEVDKISRVEICKMWLKTRVDFAKVVMTDEKLFRFNVPNN